MWFNHKTVIFGSNRNSAKAKRKLAAATASFSVERLADLGVENGNSGSNMSDLASQIIHECRFIGYRGEKFA